MRRLLAIILLLASLREASAQGVLAPVPHPTFVDNSNVLLSGGKLCTYQAGTTTPLATYSDSALTSANSNPIVMNSAGRWTSNGATETNVYLLKQSYKFILLTAGSDGTCATGTTLWTADNVPGGYDASVLIAGTLATARLGSGTADNTKVLRGDSTWSTPWTVISTTSTGTQNDFAPGLVNNTILYCNNASLLTINGIAAGYDGEMLQIVSASTGQVDLAHQNTGSLAANRLSNIATSANTSLAAGVGTALYVYRTTSSRWLLLQHEQGAWITPAFAAGNYTGGGAQTWTLQSGDVSINKYYLRGRQLFWQLTLNTTSVGGTANPELRAAIPGGFSAVVNNDPQWIRFTDNSGAFSATPGLGYVQAAGYASFYKDGTATLNWTASADNTVIQATLWCEVS